MRHLLVIDATPGPYRTEGDRMSWYLELAGGRLVAPFPVAELGERHEVTARQAGLRLLRDEATARAAFAACYRDLVGDAPPPDPGEARRRADAARRALRWCALDPEGGAGPGGRRGRRSRCGRSTSTGSG